MILRQGTKQNNASQFVDEQNKSRKGDNFNFVISLRISVFNKHYRVTGEVLHSILKQAND